MEESHNQKIATLEVQVSNFDRYMVKIDATLEKFTEMASSIDRVIAVHDERLNNQAEDIETLEKAQAIIHGRIDTIKVDIVTRMEKIDRRIAEMEKWRWVVIGGITIAVFAVSNWRNLATILGGMGS